MGENRRNFPFFQISWYLCSNQLNYLSFMAKIFIHQTMKTGYCNRFDVPSIHFLLHSDGRLCQISSALSYAGILPFITIRSVQPNPNLIPKNRTVFPNSLLDLKFTLLPQHRTFDEKSNYHTVFTSTF